MPANEKLLNTIFRGEVASVVNFGAFVSIPGTKSQGLVHKSQISNAPVDDATEVLQRGESVWCKVINFTNDGKIGLSMKVVNQGSGKDLDPNGVQIQQDERKRQAYNPRRGNQKIELDAVFNTTCSKCGCRGHQARDCFRPGDGKSYALLSDDEDSSVSRKLPQRVSSPQELSAQTKKKTKKEKKKKKSKKLKEKQKKKKDKKSKKKRRKRETSSSSSSSDSTSSSEESSSSSSSSSSSEVEKPKKKVSNVIEKHVSNTKNAAPENHRRAYSSSRHGESSRYHARYDDNRGENRRGGGSSTYEGYRPHKRYHSRSPSPNRHHRPMKRQR